MPPQSKPTSTSSTRRSPASTYSYPKSRTRRRRLPKGHGYNPDHHHQQQEEDKHHSCSESQSILITTTTTPPTTPLSSAATSSLPYNPQNHAHHNQPKYANPYKPQHEKQHHDHHHHQQQQQQSEQQEEEDLHVFDYLEPNSNTESGPVAYSSQHPIRQQQQQRRRQQPQQQQEALHAFEQLTLESDQEDFYVFDYLEPNSNTEPGPVAYSSHHPIQQQQQQPPQDPPNPTHIHQTQPSLHHQHPHIQQVIHHGSYHQHQPHSPYGPDQEAQLWQHVSNDEEGKPWGCLSDQQQYHGPLEQSGWRGFDQGREGWGPEDQSQQQQPGHCYPDVQPRRRVFNEEQQPTSTGIPRKSQVNGSIQSRHVEDILHDVPLKTEPEPLGGETWKNDLGTEYIPAGARDNAFYPAPRRTGWSSTRK